MSLSARKTGSWKALTGWQVRADGSWIGDAVEIATLFEERMIDLPLVYIREADGVDYSGNDLHLTPYGSPTTETSLDLSDLINPSIKFNGSNNLWNPEAYTEFNFTDAFTLVCLCKPSVVGDSVRQLASKGLYFGSYIGTDSKFHGHIRQIGSLVEVVSITTVEVDTTYEVAITYDSHNLKLYINGILEDTFATEAPFENGNEQSFCLGISGSDGFDGINGILDEVALYHHALTSERVLANATARLGNG